MPIRSHLVLLTQRRSPTSIASVAVPSAPQSALGTKISFSMLSASILRDVPIAGAASNEQRERRLDPACPAIAMSRRVVVVENDIVEHAPSAPLCISQTSR